MHSHMVNDKGKHKNDYDKTQAWLTCGAINTLSEGAESFHLTSQHLAQARHS